MKIINKKTFLFILLSAAKVEASCPALEVTGDKASPLFAFNGKKDGTRPSAYVCSYKQGADTVTLNRPHYCGDLVYNVAGKTETIKKRADSTSNGKASGVNCFYDITLNHQKVTVHSKPITTNTTTATTSTTTAAPTTTTAVNDDGNQRCRDKLASWCTNDVCTSGHFKGSQYPDPKNSEQCIDGSPGHFYSRGASYSCHPDVNPEGAKFSSAKTDAGAWSWMRYRDDSKPLDSQCCEMSRNLKSSSPDGPAYCGKDENTIFTTATPPTTTTTTTAATTTAAPAPTTAADCPPKYHRDETGKCVPYL